MTAAPRIAVIGAGILGAWTAWRLAASGVDVEIYEAAPVAGEGCGADSFGWLNLSVCDVQAPGFAQRVRALEMWREASPARDLVRRCWALLWHGAEEEEAAETEARAETLRNAGAPVRLIDAETALALEPALRQPPGVAIWAPEEAAAEPSEVARALLAAAESQGARIHLKTPVAALETSGPRLTALRLAGGVRREVSVAMLAAGTASQALLAPLGLREAAGVGASLATLIRLPLAEGAPPARILCGPDLELRAGPAVQGQAMQGRAMPGRESMISAESAPEGCVGGESSADAGPAGEALRALAHAVADAAERRLRLKVDRAGLFARVRARPMPAGPGEAPGGATPESGGGGISVSAPAPDLAPLHPGPEGLVLAFGHPGVILAPLASQRAAEAALGAVAKL